MRAFSDPRVAAVFSANPPVVRGKLMALRTLVFGPADRVPTSELGQCIALALTHHARNKRRRSQ